MNYSWKDRLRNAAFWQRLLSFVGALLIMVLLIPRKPLFEYEYQLNQPWRHDKLIAPFDFGIRKSDEQLAQEREEAIRSLPPVFTIDTLVTERIIHGLYETFESGMIDTGTGCKAAFEEGIERVSAMLSRGLIDRSSEALKNRRPFDQVSIQSGIELRTTPLNKLLSVQQILDTTGKLIRDSLCLVQFTSALQTHLRPNAYYNDSLTQRLLQSKLDQIIPIEGRISSGTAIIDRGEIVTPERFRILESLRMEYQERSVDQNQWRWSLVGQVSILAALLGVLMLFIRNSRNPVFNDPRQATLSLALIAVFFAVCSLSIQSDTLSVYAVPIGIAALLLRMFFNFESAILAFVVLTLTVAMFVSNPYEFIVIELSAMAFATYYQQASTRRSRMLGTAVLVFIGYSLIYILTTLAQHGDLNNAQGLMFGWFAINALLCTLVYPLVYLVEKIFGYVSETTLLELADSNQPLLNDLASKAPGTFQHSLQVANLCENVASSIGGNAVLLRTGALYHDIGKMNEPRFFIENQAGDNNPHDDLEPEESAAIIINHVVKGVEMARKQGLPGDVVKMIQTHHGTSLVRFFYQKAVELYGREKAENPEFKKLFTYPGPKPKTREQAILMMCDTVEAASRSMNSHRPEEMDELIEKLIDQQLHDGQFSDAAITFADIRKAKAALKKSLRGIYHQRVSYD